MSDGWGSCLRAFARSEMSGGWLSKDAAQLWLPLVERRWSVWLIDVSAGADRMYAGCGQNTAGLTDLASGM